MPIRKNIAHLLRSIPVVSVVASIIILLGSTGGCGKGLFPEVTSSGTVTPTPVASAFLYASNFTDGTVSAFTRNTNNGALGFIAKQSAGAVNGPVGLAVTPQNDLVYVANAADNRVYEYTIGQSGALTALASISADTTPQMVAIESKGNFVYVTNAAAKTVSQYAINSSDGTLSSNGRIVGFTGKPFGIIAHPSSQFVYVTDNTAGLIFAYSISNGILTQIGNAANSLGTGRGNPGLMAIAIDSSQGYLLVDDTVLGIVSVFLIQSNGGLVFANTFGTGQSSTTFGIAAAVNSSGSSSINYVLTANMNGNFVQPYARTGSTLTQQTSLADSGGPTGLVIDRAGNFAYTGNSGNGTIALIGINNSQCGSSPFCVIQKFASESPANANAGTQFLATTNP